MRSDPGKIFKQRQELAICKSARVNSWAVTELVSDRSLSTGGEMQPTGKCPGETRTMFLLLSAKLLGRGLSRNSQKETPFSSCLRNTSLLGCAGKLWLVRLLEPGTCYLEGGRYYRLRCLDCPWFLFLFCYSHLKDSS